MKVQITKSIVICWQIFDSKCFICSALGLCPSTLWMPLQHFWPQTPEHLDPQSSVPSYTLVRLSSVQARCFDILVKGNILLYVVHVLTCIAMYFWKHILRSGWSTSSTSVNLFLLLLFCSWKGAAEYFNQRVSVCPLASIKIHVCKLHKFSVSTRCHDSFLTWWLSSAIHRVLLVLWLMLFSQNGSHTDTGLESVT